MSLQIWLPLNGNLDNNGAASATITNNGATSIAGAPCPEYNYSMSFSSSSYISISVPTITGYANSYTFSWWAKGTNGTNTMYWGFSDGNRLNLYSTGNTYCWNTGDGATNKFTDTSINAQIDGNWHHFAITGDGTITKLYIDSAFKANATTYKAITGTNIILNGWDTGTNYKFAGQLSDFRIYSTALSEDEIYEIYHTTKYQKITRTSFTDKTFFSDESDLYIKEIHINELRNAVAQLNSYLTNVNNCGGPTCESCQDSCTCQSDTCQSCQNTCTNCTSKNQSCQNSCTQCSNCTNQKCQTCQSQCR